MLLQGWARDGLTEAQIARKIGVSVPTLQLWKSRFEPIAQAMSKSKEVVDIEVENALLRRALGYEYTETRTEETDKGLKTVTVQKHVPGETAAQFFWLKNRCPDKWRDKPQPEENTEQYGVILMPEVVSGDA